MGFNAKIEGERSLSGDTYVEYLAERLVESKAFREDYETRINVVKHETMPFERSPDGLIKHIIHEKMNTKECCIEVYQQFIASGKATGKHRHLSEEIAFIIEGSGYDLHWDVNFDCEDEFSWEWEAEPRRFEWAPGDFIYIPPYCVHKRFSTDANDDARIIVINNKIIRDMGFDWFEQIENAEGF